MPNALLVYPEHPPTFWGADHALEMSGVKATHPPLGLLTVAALFPPGYELRVVDMNVSTLEDADLEWADLVFTSTMLTQQVSLLDVSSSGATGQVFRWWPEGPIRPRFTRTSRAWTTSCWTRSRRALRHFLRDLERGTAKANVPGNTRKPDVTLTPIPRFDLIELEELRHHERAVLSRMSVRLRILRHHQALRPRAAHQVAGTDPGRAGFALYRLGWRGPVFLVDDNFIGNKRDAMRLLPAIAKWQKAKGSIRSL